MLTLLKKKKKYKYTPPSIVPRSPIKFFLQCCWVPNHKGLISLTYTYYINLVEAIMKHQKLCLTCTESPSSSMVSKSLSNFRVIFVVNTKEWLMESKNKIRTFGGWKSPKNKKIEPGQIFTGSFKKSVIKTI